MMAPRVEKTVELVLDAAGLRYVVVAATGEHKLAFLDITGKWVFFDKDMATPSHDEKEALPAATYSKDELDQAVEFAKKRWPRERGVVAIYCWPAYAGSGPAILRALGIRFP